MGAIPPRVSLLPEGQRRCRQPQESESGVRTSDSPARAARGMRGPTVAGQGIGGEGCLNDEMLERDDQVGRRSAVTVPDAGTPTDTGGGQRQRVLGREEERRGSDAVG